MEDIGFIAKHLFYLNNTSLEDFFTLFYSYSFINYPTQVPLVLGAAILFQFFTHFTDFFDF